MNLKGIILYSDLYFAFVAIGTGLAAYALYGLPLSEPAPLLIIALLALNVCSTNRQIDEEVDKLNVPERTRFLMKHGKTIYFFSVAGLLVALALAFMKSAWVGSAGLMVFLFGHFYSHPFPRVGRLREFFIIKNVSVGLIWALMSLITPFYFGVMDLSVLALFMLFFMRMTFQTGLIDLRDVDGDAKAGIRTVPMSLGRERTLMLSHVVNVLPLALFYLTGSFFGIPQEFLILSALMSLNGLVYIIGIGFSVHTYWMYAVVIDSETFLPSFMLLAAKTFGLL